MKKKFTSLSRSADFQDVFNLGENFRLNGYLFKFIIKTKIVKTNNVDGLAVQEATEAHISGHKLGLKVKKQGLNAIKRNYINRLCRLFFNNLVFNLDSNEVTLVVCYQSKKRPAQVKGNNKSHQQNNYQNPQLKGSNNEEAKSLRPSKANFCHDTFVDLSMAFKKFESNLHKFYLT